MRHKLGTNENFTLTGGYALVLEDGVHSSCNVIMNSDNGTSLDIYSSDGACLTTRSGDNVDPGAFVLTARSGSTYKQFRGGPDGSLTWDSERIPTSPDASVLKIVKLTQQQYDALTTKDSTTLYIIV